MTTDLDRAAHDRHAKAPPSAVARLDEIEREVRAEIGGAVANFADVFGETRGVLAALDPPADAAPLGPEEQTKKRARLSVLLDDIEDRLDAFRIAIGKGMGAARR